MVTYDSSQGIYLDAPTNSQLNPLYRQIKGTPLAAIKGSVSSLLEEGAELRWDAEAHVDVLAVHPDHAGRGLGSALLHAAFRAAADAGLPAVSLGVDSDNPRALGLYTRAGMTERWRIDSYEKPVPHWVPE